ncbi:MAG: hypothetical protein ACRD2G_07585 [Terriglobia bacterium]
MTPFALAIPKFDLRRARAYLALGQFPQAIAAAQRCWQSEVPSPDRAQARFHSDHPYLELERQWRAKPANLNDALALTEACAERIPTDRNLALIQSLAQSFPNQPRILWVLFDTYRNLGRDDLAAQTAIRLAQSRR